MYCIVGLGNPGEPYAKTRHNVGFATVELFASTHSFPDFTFDKKSNALISEGVIGEEKLILAKPQTMMNNSGEAVKKLNKNRLVVVHDDIDLPTGSVRVSTNRGSAGHKGVESIMQHLKSKEFTRVRIGIQPERGKLSNINEFVLKKFLPEEVPAMQQAIQQASDELVTLVTQ